MRLDLKIRMVKGEGIQTLLYGCANWIIRQERYMKSPFVCHRVLLRILGAIRRKSDHRVLSHNRAFELTECTRRL